jgi:anti-sigma regulatory factor (Ser/Thr protein kinase)
MEENPDDAAVDESRLREIDDDGCAGGDDGVELRSDSGNGAQVMLAAQRDHGHVGQVFDDDSADFWHRPLRPRRPRFYPGRWVCVERHFLPVYPLRGRGSHDRMVGAEQTAPESADFQVRLPCEPASVPQARSHVRDWCHQARIRGDIVSDVQLAVTEAATNAVHHSGCEDFEVQGWMGDSTLIVSVWDQGQGRDDPKPGAGLGTRIIRALADAVDFEHTEPGTRVTMRFPRHSYL